jgi:O-succinylbenzoic acid--CoA ligase
MSADFDWLATRARLSPDRTALIEGDRDWSYSELNRYTAGLASRLVEVDLKPRDRLGLFMPTRVRAIALFFAIQRIGAIPVLLNNRLTPTEIRKQLEGGACKALVSLRTRLDGDSDIIGIFEREILIEDYSSKPAVEYGNRTNAERYLSRKVDPNETCAIVFTSGSGGKPLGVMLTYSNCLWSALGSTLRLGRYPDDRWLACLPLFHIGGLSILIRSCLDGATTILQEKFDPTALIEAVRDRGASLIPVVPTMLHRLISESAGVLGGSALRVILVGGGKISDPLLQRALAEGLPIALTYGLTEAASQVATATPEETRKKPGSAGKPLFFNEVSIRSDSRASLPAGEIGEIVVHGPTVMEGYSGGLQFGDRQLNSRELFTGDLGYLDADGDLWVVGRREGLINTGGEKVHVSEIEAAILSHPGVREVSVVGIEDPEWGQQVAAALVWEGIDPVGEKELVEFLRPRIGAYKLPRRVLFLTELPRTGSGKIDTAAVRRKFEATDGSEPD